MKVKCPCCNELAEWSDNPARPFCSPRCRLIDLGRWSSEDYRLPDLHGVPVAVDDAKQSDEDED